MIESVLTYNIVSWYYSETEEWTFHGITVKQKNELTRVINEANKIIGQKQHITRAIHIFFGEKGIINIFSPDSSPPFLLRDPSFGAQAYP